MGPGVCDGSGPAADTAMGRFPPFLCVKCSWFVSSHEGSQQLWHALKRPDLRQSPTSRTPGRRELNVSVCQGVNWMQNTPVWWGEAHCRCQQGHPRSFPWAGLVPVTVTLSLLCLTAALLLRETFQVELERCVILCSALSARTGSPEGSVPGNDPSVSPGACGGQAATNSGLLPGTSWVRAQIHQGNFGSRIEAHKHPCGPKNWVCE